MPLKTERPIPSEPEHLSCAVCLSDIPPSVDHTLEGPDYVQHFCGIDCLDIWRQKRKKQKKRGESSGPVEGEG
jgi:hypothetical protein